jgi:adenylate cyclase
MNRRTAVILAADIAGYSRLAAEDAAGATRRFGEIREALATLAPQYQGHFFTMAADCCLAEFVSAAGAVEFAAEVKRITEARSTESTVRRRTRLRFGLAKGPVTERNCDVVGPAVDLAVSLRDAAPAGGIAVEGGSTDALQAELAIRDFDIGFVALPGWRGDGDARGCLVTMLRQAAQPAEFPDDETAAPEEQDPEVPEWAVKANRGAQSPSWRPDRRHVAIGAGVVLVAALAGAILLRADTPHAVPLPAPTANAPAGGLKTDIAQPFTAQPPAAPSPPTPPASVGALNEPGHGAAPVRPAGDAAAMPEPAASVAPAPAAEPRKHFVKSCADILERAQLGDLSSADREALQHECRPGRR